MKKRNIFFVIFLFLLLISILFFMLKELQGFDALSGRVEIYFEGNQKELAEKAASIINDSNLVQESILRPFECSASNHEGLMMCAQMLSEHDIPFFKLKLMETLKRQLPDVDMTGLKIIDYKETVNILRQFPRGLVWLSEMFLFALLFIAIVRKSIHFHSWFKEELKHFYSEEVIRKKGNSILQKTGVILILLVPTIYLLNRIVGFQLEIPGEFLPPRDIFDLAFYLEQAGSRIQRPSPNGIAFYRLIFRFEILSVLYVVFLLILFLVLLLQIRKIGSRN